MDFSKVELQPGLKETLEAAFKKLKRIEPEITESIFMERIIRNGLKPYLRSCKPLHRNNVILRNDLKNAFHVANKTQSEVAKETGIERVYISHLISGKYKPSVEMALLISHALNMAVEDLFYLQSE
jgi:DNA-binding XRE family transcriptional regulator